MKKRTYTLLLFAILPLLTWAQAFITGQIVDTDGYAIPLASATYKGHHIAVASDIEGRFKIERHEGWDLSFSSVGFKTQIVKIDGDTPTELKITLKEDAKKLSEVVIRSGRGKYSRKNNPAVELMRKVIEAKKKTHLDNHDYYQYNNYQKITLALNDINPEGLETGMYKKYQWMLDQVEMSPYTHKLILPVSVEETLTQKLYRKSPHTEKSIVKGHNSSGVNEILQTGDIINTVLKDVFTDIDIYDDEVRLFQYPFTSPIGKGAIAFYRYYITDTVYVGKDRCIHLDFIPNNQQDFGFRGELYVLDDSSYQVKRCELTIPKKSDVNFVENMQCVQEFEKLETGEWVLTQDDMMCELEAAKNIGKAVVTRITRRSDYAFDPLPKSLMKGKKDVLKDAYAEMRGDDFWQQYRQVELTKSESSMDQFVHKLEQLKGVKYVVFALKALVENFVETGTREHPSKVDIGPVNTIVSQNFYDKVRMRASAQTTANFNPHIFLKGYYAHGFESKQDYYDAELIYTFNKPGYLPREFPKQAITFQSMRDVALPSDKFIQTDKDNMFTSFKVTEIDKMFLYNRQEISFEYEQEWGFKTFASAKTEKVTPIGNIAFERLSDGKFLHHIRYTEATVGVRYAPGETFINTKQHRWPINLDAPVFRLQHTMGFKGPIGGRYNYNFTEAEIYKRLWMPWNWGKLDTRIKAGAQWNQVPYPLLIMPAANLGYILEDQTFNLINNMEFLNDRYASVMIDWDLNGKIFNRIPLLRKLKWREWLGVKVLWGTLTDKNNPYIQGNTQSDILMRFPDGCYIMDEHTPYVEASIGIHNILKLIHVDYVRRLNYLDRPTANKWGIRFMIRTTF